jgi:hypothetical protein
MDKLPIIFLMHPVGIGSTRTMNVASTKMWIRALVDILPDVVISAPWLPYAEVGIDRDRGLRDAFVCIERHDGAVAVGGEFSMGMRGEWDRFGALKLPRIDLTRKPLPGLLTTENFPDALKQFRHTIIEAFQPVLMKKAAA